MTTSALVAEWRSHTDSTCAAERLELLECRVVELLDDGAGLIAARALLQSRGDHQLAIHYVDKLAARGTTAHATQGILAYHFNTAPAVTGARALRWGATTRETCRCTLHIDPTDGTFKLVFVVGSDLLRRGLRLLCKLQQLDFGYAASVR